jgi:hypothetical protein
MMFQVEHRPGALAEAMNVFKRNRLNLTWIESFPLQGKSSEYLFFVELEGHETDLRVRRAIESLRAKTDRLEVLGFMAEPTCGVIGTVLHTQTLGAAAGTARRGRPMWARMLFSVVLWSPWCFRNTLAVWVTALVPRTPGPRREIDEDDCGPAPVLVASRLPLVDGRPLAWGTLRRSATRARR